MADGVPYVIPPTIEDSTVIDEIKTNLDDLGYPRTRVNTTTTRNV
jgi:hypothetical protein